MVAMTVRVVAATLMLAFCSAATLAQPTGSAIRPTPAIHPATGLKLPSVIGRDIRLARSIDHGRDEAKPELGYSLTYLVASPLDGVARVNIFNGGLTRYRPEPTTRSLQNNSTSFSMRSASSPRTPKG